MPRIEPLAAGCDKQVRYLSAMQPPTNQNFKVFRLKWHTIHLYVISIFGNKFDEVLVWEKKNFKQICQTLDKLIFDNIVHYIYKVHFKEKYPSTVFETIASVNSKLKL